ncbi:hypothetical protein C8F04DRAFT_559067 [Mycena alexandri]|uniref:Uncharacterized protein n=1 Tax=Mycena alexandri TaxID=1745969 RepID=A0AAD6SV81_9AGAR|nr:hypothetical protein C8F04DRAFT_559067 [Mycena alexandri]
MCASHGCLAASLSQPPPPLSLPVMRPLSAHNMHLSMSTASQHLLFPIFYTPLLPNSIALHVLLLHLQKPFLDSSSLIHLVHMHSHLFTWRPDLVPISRFCLASLLAHRTPFLVVSYDLIPSLRARHFSCFIIVLSVSPRVFGPFRPRASPLGSGSFAPAWWLWVSSSRTLSRLCVPGSAVPRSVPPRVLPLHCTLEPRRPERPTPPHTHTLSTALSPLSLISQLRCEAPSAHPSPLPPLTSPPADDHLPCC